jgi:hypothetical protein
LEEANAELAAAQDKLAAVKAKVGEMRSLKGFLKLVFNTKFVLIKLQKKVCFQLYSYFRY